MRNLKPILIIAFTSGIAAWLLPWWFIAVAAFVVAVSNKLKPKDGFISGFLGVALMWLVVFLFRDMQNEHILSTKMAKLLNAPNYVVLLIITIILGGIVGGLGGWSGAMMNKGFRK